MEVGCLAVPTPDVITRYQLVLLCLCVVHSISCSACGHEKIILPEGKQWSYYVAILPQSVVQYAGNKHYVFCHTHA